MDSLCQLIILDLVCQLPMTAVPDQMAEIKCSADDEQSEPSKKLVQIGT